MGITLGASFTNAGEMREAAASTAEELQCTSTTQGRTHAKLGITLTHNFPTDYQGTISTTRSGWQLGDNYNVIAIVGDYGFNSNSIYFTYELSNVKQPRLARVPLSDLSMSDREIARAARRSIATAKRTVLGENLRRAERELATIQRQYRGREREMELLEKALKCQRSALRAMEDKAVQASERSRSERRSGSKKQPRGAAVSE